MLPWFRSHGELLRVGVEATGSYGAALTRHLALCGIPVLEVTGPDSSSRRSHGKDDSLDAISAARAALGGWRVRVAKDRSGAVEALRVLRTTCKTAVRARRATLPQLHNTVVASPEEIRNLVRQHDPHAAHSYLRLLEAGHDCLSRSGGGHQDRSQIPG